VGGWGMGRRDPHPVAQASRTQSLLADPPPNGEGKAAHSACVV